MNTLSFKSHGWWKKEWDLCWNNRVIGTIKLKEKLSGISAEVISGDNKWNIGYKGFLTNHFFVFDALGSTVVKNVHPKKFKRWGFLKQIELEGNQYTISSGPWNLSFAVTDKNGEDVIGIKRRWWKAIGTGEVSTKHSPEDDTIKLLIFILFYEATLADRISYTPI